jgi:micrococcal nuclease
MRRGPLALLLALSASCSAGGAGERSVVEVLDGDTIVVDGGEHVRLLGIDSPERFTDPECWGDDSFNWLSGRLAGKKVRLVGDVVHLDDFGRTLAWVYLGDELIEATSLAEGQSCVLIIPPNGSGKASYLQTIESGARAQGKGLWSACGGCNTPAFAPGGAAP